MPLKRTVPTIDHGRDQRTFRQAAVVVRVFSDTRTWPGYRGRSCQEQLGDFLIWPACCRSMATAPTRSAPVRAQQRGLARAIRAGRAFCLAHARRQFVAVHKTTQSPEALDIVRSSCCSSSPLDGCPAIASLERSDLDGGTIAEFLDHIEATARTPLPHNCRRAALRSFFKHLVRNDLAHSSNMREVLAIPSKKARRQPATYLEADDVRAIIAKPNQRTRRWMA